MVDGGVRGLSVYGTRSSQQGKGKDVLCCVEKGWLMLFVGFSDFVVGLFGPHFLSTQDEFPDCVCLSVWCVSDWIQIVTIQILGV